LIDDVIIEGVGLIDNDRAQSSDILSSSSDDTLIQRIKAKVAEETSTGSEGRERLPHLSSPDASLQTS
jgi:hypothetical protein